MVYRTAMPHLTQVTKFHCLWGDLVRDEKEYRWWVVSQN